MIQLVIGLGNPGRQYEHTRHNIGQLVLLEFLRTHHADTFKKKFHSRYASLPAKNIHCILPDTYMNQSGKAAEAARSFFSLSPAELLFIHDDIETAYGKAVFISGGGLKGHKGLRSAAQVFSSREFYRLALGVGRPEQGSVSSHVLQRFSKEEEAYLPGLVQSATRYLERILSGEQIPGEPFSLL